MPHSDIFERFKSYFPEHAQKVVAWFPHGHNAIRIRSCEGMDYVFTHDYANEWSLRTFGKGGFGM